MDALAPIVGGVAALLIVLGLVGGGFTFAGSTMPRVGRAARFSSLACGAALLLVAIFLGLLGAPLSGDAQAQPPAPAGPAPSAPTLKTYNVQMQDGWEANVFADPYLSSRIVATQMNGTSVNIYCTAQGDIAYNAGMGTQSSLWDRIDTGWIADVNVNTRTDQPVMPQCE